MLIPAWSFDRIILKHDGNHVVILRVYEFEDIPILCRRNVQGEKGKPLLRDGACYVRSRRKPETAEIPTHEDMRELLELATEKRLRAFLRQARAAGFDIAGGAQPTDQELFAQQLGELRGLVV